MIPEKGYVLKLLREALQEHEIRSKPGEVAKYLALIWIIERLDRMKQKAVIEPRTK